jgi:hypothetical protein
MTKVTYTPLENGDPIETSFGGFSFTAGKPVDIPDSATIDTIERVVKLDAEGNEIGKGMAKKVKIVDRLRTNPYFLVEGSKQAPPPKKGAPRLPQTPEEYRGWAQNWFKTCETPTELHDRWQAEADMRERLSVHEDSDVVSFLRPFYEARFDELRKAAA